MPSMGGHGPTTIHKTWPFLVLHVMTVNMYFSHFLSHMDCVDTLSFSKISGKVDRVPLPVEWGTSATSETIFRRRNEFPVLRYIQHVELCFLLLHVKHMVSFDMQLCKKTTCISKSQKNTIESFNVLMLIMIWLVVSTHLKNISQIGNLPQIGMKIKHIWNHHLVIRYALCWQGHRHDKGD